MHDGVDLHHLITFIGEGVGFSVARAALAPGATVVAAKAAVPIPAAALAAGAPIATSARVAHGHGILTEGGHCSKGKEQQAQCERLHGHVGSSSGR
jgi:hypothetical protein